MKKSFVTKILQDGIRTILRSPKYRWLAIIGSLIYFVSPIDIIPDTIPFLGWIDDGVLISFVIAEISQIIWEYLQAHPKRRPQASETVPIDTIPVNNTIDVDAVAVN